MERIRVGILYGGRSVEHEISIRSAKNVFSNIDQNTYSPILIGISKSGKWYVQEKIDNHILESDALSVELDAEKPVFRTSKGKQFKLDIVFPVLHGTDGEDGSVQGFLECMNIAYVGSGVLGSSVAMSKTVSKNLLKHAGVPVAPGVSLKNSMDYDLDEIVAKFGLPLIVKPSNLGSSVGVSKVSSQAELKEAVNQAFQFDDELLIETFVTGREMECAILGNENVKATPPGEIVLHGNHELYSYDAKYEDEDAAEIRIPAEVDQATIKKIKSICIQAYEALNCKDLARVDFFLTQTGDIVVNEINTIPGFTSISMYPKLCELIGVDYKELITELLQLAFKRHKDKQGLETSFK